MTGAFNPLDMNNLGLSVATAMLDTDPTPLGKLPKPADLLGAGVYAIYYTGDFPAYRLLADQNRNDQFLVPIYVGKAVPDGARTGGSTDPTKKPKPGPLRTRLVKHKGSVNHAENLKIEDFWCRWLVVEPIWIPLGESVMISRTKPVWNRVVPGFGLNDPGSGRHKGEVSRWDVLHPGRPFVKNLKPRRDTDAAAHIEADVLEYLRSRLG